MLAAVDRRGGKRSMRGERRRDHYRVDITGPDQASVIGAGLDAGMTALGRLTTLGPRVGNHRQSNAVGFGKIARQIRTPVAVADEADVQHRERNSAAAAAT